MPDQGYRSVEINCTNDTRGNLVVQGPSVGQACAWIQGESAKQGDPLNQYTESTWGVSTNDIDANSSGQVQLTGLGSYPVVISFSNNEAGVSTCSVAPNDAVTGLVTQVDTGEQSHSQFNVQLIPN